MLTLEALRIELGTFRLAADLSVEAGARIPVMGPSGAGKSTLLSVIGGFLSPAQGRLLWQDRDITAEPPDGRPVATIFQDNNLFPHLTAAQNVGLGIRPALRLPHAERERVGAVLARVGLDGLGSRKPAALSGGQQSRVALARAVLQDKPVLLLDEPFAALGPALKTEMIELVLELAGEDGRTILMISHDPADARRLGGQTLLVAGGTAHSPQDTDELLANPPEALRDYLGHANSGPVRK